jgi:Uma2 family endonuclease
LTLLKIVPMHPTTPPADTPTHPASRPGEPAWEVALLFPAQGEWTEAEYLALDAHRLVELSDGCLEVLPMPTIFHQLVVKFLLQWLEGYVSSHAGGGMVLFAPLPIRLGAGKFREPDVVYLRPERAVNLHGQPDGADLVIEVVSEGAENRHRDLEIKRQEYSAAGITEYWIVDPEQQRVTVLTLEGQSYRVHGAYGPGTRATSVLLPGLAVDVEAVLSAGRAKE